MIEAKAKPQEKNISSGKSAMFAMILVMVVTLGLYGYNAFRAFQSSAPSQSDMATITQNVLDEKYGLRVQLVAVTAAGGLVDLRLQITDGEKAQAFLEDRTNFPALRVGNDTVLRASEDAIMQDIQFENGKSIFVLFSNSGDVLKPGDPVSIVFGNTEVEAVQAK